jgi:hypothetical protein
MAKGRKDSGGNSASYRPEGRRDIGLRTGGARRLRPMVDCNPMQTTDTDQEKFLRAC